MRPVGGLTGRKARQAPNHKQTRQMQTAEINLTYTATRACPTLAKAYGFKNAVITATAKAYRLGGNSHPHFSVTADIYEPGRSHDPFACGCMHEEVLIYFPKLAPLVALHLSNADDGEPMHATANGFYWLAGAVSHHFEQRYHGGNSPQNFPLPADKIDPAKPWSATEHPNPTEAEALAIMAKHLRISDEEARAVRDAVNSAFNISADKVANSQEVKLAALSARAKAGRTAAKEAFAAYVDTLRSRWATEAQAGLALIESLNS